jgi:hypothetical protein
MLLLAATLAAALAMPAVVAAHGGRPSYATTKAPYVAPSGAVAGMVFKALINSGESAFGTLFEGIPDGIGAAPAGGHHWHGWGWWRPRYVDLYVTHEQSRVPFSGFADYQDSSVSRVRVDTRTMRIVDLDVALSPDEGFIRFCSAFMAGPEHGFKHYTFLANEESNDPLNVPAGAEYGSDPAYGGQNIRQAGFSVALDTKTGHISVLEGAGRHNHENQVIVPGRWWRGIFALSGDDTFTSPSTPERPNLSQLYAYTASDAKDFMRDDGKLWAFRVTGTQDGPVDKEDPFNGANDYFDIAVGDDFRGEFIKVPEDIARGDTADLPQDALEDWSNANNVFQFIRVEDIAYDPDHPRTVYFADTGNSRLIDPGTGRLYRAPSGTPGTLTSLGRIYKMELNRWNPRKVDSFSVVTESETIGMRAPDNLDVGRRSLMVQEDASDAKIWQMDLATGAWTHIATATQPTAETSGIVDVSRWFGRGWWAIDVQSHVNTSETPGQVYTGPGPSNGVTFTARREDGQLLLMYVPGS